MLQLAGLHPDRLDDVGMAVTDRSDRDAGEEVEVFLAFVVEEQRALAPDELDSGPFVGLHHVSGLVGLQLFIHGVTIVPMPTSVKSSSSSECGRRPSMM